MQHTTGVDSFLFVVGQDDEGLNRTKPRRYWTHRVPEELLQACGTRRYPRGITPVCMQSSGVAVGDMGEWRTRGNVRFNLSTPY